MSPDELMTHFRVNAANRPFWLFVALVITFLALTLMARRAGLAFRVGNGRAAAALGAAAVAVYVVTAVWYTTREQYFDHAEPTIAAVGWLAQSGRPIYHDLNAAERYSHIYGPLAFVFPGWSLAWFGPSIVASKIAGAAAGLLAVAAVFWIVRSTGQRQSALALTGLFAAMCLMFRHLSFWIRPDSFQLLFVAIAVLSATLSRGLAAGIVVGVAIGVLANLKLTGPLYAAPALVLVYRRFGWRPAGLAVAAAIIVGAAPFVLMPNVSFANYMAWVGLSARNGLSFWTLRQNLEWGIFLLVPMAPSLLASGPSSIPSQTHRWLVASLGLAFGGVVIAASKPGAGPNHVMPFLPWIIYVLASYPLGSDGIRRQALFVSARVAFVVTIGLVALAQVVYLVRGVGGSPGRSAVDDIVRFAAVHPRSNLAIGYSEHGDRLAMLRPLLVFRGNSYLLDAPAIQEYEMSGLDLPAKTLAAVRQCTFEFWMIPKGGEPFAVRNNYPSTGYRPLFSAEFQRTFFNAYSRVGQTEYYDVWQCRSRSGH